MPTVTFVPQCVAEHICGEYDFTISLMPPGEGANITGDYLPIACDDTETPCAGLVMFDVEQALAVIGVAKWFADRMGYALEMHPDGVGTAQHYNRHVYRTLDAADGRDQAAYYAELERNDRMMMP